MDFKKLKSYFQQNDAVDELRSKHRYLRAAGDLFLQHVGRHHPNVAVFSHGAFEKQILRDLKDCPLPEVERKYLGVMNDIFAAIFDHLRQGIEHHQPRYRHSLSVLETFKSPSRFDLPAPDDLAACLATFAAQIEELHGELLSAPTERIAALWADHFDTSSGVVSRCDQLMRRMGQCIDRAELELEKARTRRHSRVSIGVAVASFITAVGALFNPLHEPASGSAPATPVVQEAPQNKEAVSTSMPPTTTKPVPQDSAVTTKTDPLASQDPDTAPSTTPGTAPPIDPPDASKPIGSAGR